MEDYYARHCIRTKMYGRLENPHNPSPLSPEAWTTEALLASRDRANHLRRLPKTPLLKDRIRQMVITPWAAPYGNKRNMTVHFPRGKNNYLPVKLGIRSGLWVHMPKPDHKERRGR